MNTFLVLVILTFAGLVFAVEKEVRKTKCGGVHAEPDAEPEDEPSKCLDCKERCKCLPKIETIAFSALTERNLTSDLVMVCTPGSYFKRIEYHNSWKQKVTCNGVVVTDKDYIPGVYIGIKDTPNGEVSVKLNTKRYHCVQAFNNGQCSEYERLPLVNCECEGSILTTFSVWVSDNPIQGCCTTGVSRFDIVYDKMTIKSKGHSKKCCSECYLQQGTVMYTHTGGLDGVTN